MDTETTDLERQMLARVRRHMVISFAGLLLTLVGFGALGAARRTPDSVLASPLWGTLAAVGLLLLLPLIGFSSTYRNLRCPACDRMVAFQASANASFFGARAPKKCFGCGAKIFGDEIVRRFRRLAAIIAGGMILLVAVGVLSRFLG